MTDSNRRKKARPMPEQSRLTPFLPEHNWPDALDQEDAVERHIRVLQERKVADVAKAAADTPEALAKSLGNAMEKHKALAAEMGVTPANCSDVFECDQMTACLQHLGTLSPRELRQRQFRLADWMMAYQCGRGGRNKCPEDAMCKIPWMCSRDRHLSHSDFERKNGITKGMSCDQHGPLIYAWDTLLMWVAAITDYDWCSELLGRPKLDRSIL